MIVSPDKDWVLEDGGDWSFGSWRDNISKNFSFSFSYIVSRYNLLYGVYRNSISQDFAVFHLTILLMDLVFYLIYGLLP